MVVVCVAVQANAEHFWGASCGVRSQTNHGIHDDRRALCMAGGTGENGSLIAVSYEARRRGVTRQMRGNEARKKCPELQLVQVEANADPGVEHGAFDGGLLGACDGA